MSAGIVPFSNGSEFMDWDEMNCCRCVKGYQFADGRGPVEDDTPPDEFLCPIQRAVYESMGTGSVPREIADRHGLSKHEDFAYVTCLELVEVHS